MASYLLLRNNQKNGPFNLDDLLKYGLKPYDLVWVEGKSAAWRYPSEIAELKSFAPAVEEQPYDRFYKKNTETQDQAIAVAPKLADPVIEQPVVQQTQSIEEKYAKYIPKKSVFVTMPGGGASTSSASATSTSSASATSANSSAAGSASNSSTSANSAQIQKPPVPQPEPIPAPTITVTENPEAARIKFSQPLDEIKEMYVKTLQHRKSKIARKNFLMTNLKRAAVIAGLIAVGIFAGLAIKSNSGADDTQAQQPLQKAIPASAALSGLETAADEPALQENGLSNNTHSPAITHLEPVPLPPHVKQRLQEEEQKELIASSRLKKETPLITPAERLQFEEQAEPVERDPSTGERSKKVRTDNPDDRPVAKTVMAPRKSGLSNLVSVTSNEYKRVAFGGIRNLELTITNDSKYVLDKVTVELNYLKPSEEPLKTELIQFHSVSPNGSMTMKIKDTNRGIKVSYKIVDIQSQQTETVAGF